MSTAQLDPYIPPSSSSAGFARLLRVFRKPPNIVWQRTVTELQTYADRYRAPRRTQQFDPKALLAATETASIAELWTFLSNRTYAVPVGRVAPADYEMACPGDAARIAEAAKHALARRVDLLGTGPVELGVPIDWHRDFKTGHTWPAVFMRDINYTNLGLPSDVKIPWEISRLQWLIPAGQMYALTGEEQYAEAVRDVLDEWIDANPYAHSVNWTCTMEVAMRIITWTWFFHVFCRSRAWADETFRARFLRTLFLHGEFTQRYIERSDVNGNHFTADAAGLLFAGLFFSRGASAKRWADEGWRQLCDELPRQVTQDGVDFEASVAYHRLVFELFFLSARLREAHGLVVPDAYRARVVAMARFAQAYTRPDGTTPLVGDADDARVLPFGGQAVGDHRYVAALVGAHWDIRDLRRGFSGSRAEVLWTLGRRAASMLAADEVRGTAATSASFPQGGFFVMRNADDHVFIDCGPVGQAGRGGHGHNDCLGFEATLAGVHLVTDCGAFVYTASVAERNRFRSSGYHNTPRIDGEELNRFVRWDYLWSLHDDAKPEIRQWETGQERDVFVGAHSGYRRLAEPVVPVRTITLEHETHTLRIEDRFTGNGDHDVEIPMHIAPGVEVTRHSSHSLLLRGRGRTFLLEWTSELDWNFAIGEARVSPQYGVVVAATRLMWRRTGTLSPLTVLLSTIDVAGTKTGINPLSQPAA